MLGFAGHAAQRFIFLAGPAVPSWNLAACFAIYAAYRCQLQVRGRPLGGPRFVPPGHIAEKILLSKAALEGERKQLSVLFADLKGSTEHVANLDPDHARRLLDPVLERMMEAVYQYEGTVNQVMGDGIMALFGAPLALEDHAIRACHAALRMQEIIKAHADEVLRTEGVPLEIRVGLNSGDVIVRSIGSDLHMNYTAMGLTTHLAARMEQVAAPGSIYMTAQTLRLVEGYVAVRPLGSLDLKGVTEPVETLELRVPSRDARGCELPRPET